MFGILIRLAHSSPSAILQRQALLVLRNLAFSSTHKARIVAECKVLPVSSRRRYSMCSSEIHPYCYVSRDLKDVRYILYWTHRTLGIDRRCAKGQQTSIFHWWRRFLLQGKVAVRSSNVLPALYDVKTQQRNKENLLCYHAVSNVIQLLTED